MKTTTRKKPKAKSATQTIRRKPLTTTTAISGGTVELQDVTRPSHLELTIDERGKTLWVNVDGICLLRACQIGELVLVDNRPPMSESHYIRQVSVQGGACHKPPAGDTTFNRRPLPPNPTPGTTVVVTALEERLIEVGCPLDCNHRIGKICSGRITGDPKQIEVDFGVAVDGERWWVPVDCVFLVSD